MKRLVLMLAAMLAVSPVLAAGEEQIATYFGNTILTYSKTGATYRAHHYPDKTFVMERPTGVTKGVWAFNEKGEQCITQITPPRNPATHCHRVEPGKKPGDSWDMEAGDASHHNFMIAGDVYKPAPDLKDPMHGYYDNVLEMTDGKDFRRRIYYNPDHSQLNRRPDGDVWNHWELKDNNKTICVWPWKTDKSKMACHPFVPFKNAGDTWDHFENGRTLTAKLTKGRPITITPM